MICRAWSLAIISAILLLLATTTTTTLMAWTRRKLSNGSILESNNNHAKDGTVSAASTAAVQRSLSWEAFGFSSAFEDSLYHFLLPPYNDNPCQPSRIHIAQATNVVPPHDNNNNNGHVNMTLSFTVPYNLCAHVRTIVEYGRGIVPEGIIDSHSNNNNNDTAKPISFHYDASEAVPFLYNYQSDWIHHITLPYLQPGLERYWYKIRVVLPPPSTAAVTEDAISPPTCSLTAINNNNNLRRRRDCGWTSSFWRPKQSSSTNNDNPVLLLLGETPLYHFRTAPWPGQSTSLALVGDLGQTENSTKTMRHILHAATQPSSTTTSSKTSSSTTVPWPMIIKTKSTNSSNGFEQQHLSAASPPPPLPPPVSALLIAGDLSYADGDPRRWESWLEIMEPLLRSTPLQAAAGNHEIECDNTTNQVFVPYESYFRNPNRINNADVEPVDPDYKKTLWNHQCLTSSQFLGHYNYGNAFYAFEHGLAHIIVLNSYTDTSPTSPQYQWLEKHLKQTAAAMAVSSSSSSSSSLPPWLLVMFHCPLHTTFIGHNGEINSANMLKHMEPLFYKYGVNIVLSGHDHAYLRTKPMQGNHSDPSGLGPIYLTLGAGGNREQHTAGFLHPDTPEEWVAKRDNDEYGYGHLHLINASHAYFNWVRDGTTELGVHDSLWIVHQRYQEFVQ